MSKFFSIFFYFAIFLIVILPISGECKKKIRIVKALFSNDNSTAEESKMWTSEDWKLFTVWSVGIIVFLLILILIFCHCKTLRMLRKRRNRTRNTTPTFKYDQDRSRVQMSEPIPLGFSTIEQNVQQSQRNPYGSTTEPLHLHSFSKY